MKNKNLVLEYLREEEIDKEKQKLEAEYNLKKEDIVISKEKTSKFKIFYNFISSFFMKLFKLFIYIAIFLLVTVGATVFMNESLRNQILSVFMQNI